MTTRLGQKRVKSSDPAYQHLEEQLHARTQGSGEGYTVPAGGIPRTDMTKDVQEALASAESSYQKPEDGIPVEDLTQKAREALEHGLSAYIKPEDGIPLEDLAESIRNILDAFGDYYIYPEGGIPRVDLARDVQMILTTAANAYQLPEEGIPLSDLAREVLDLIETIQDKYVKPEAGIPLSDLDTDVATQAELDEVSAKMEKHIKNNDVHITDHNDLKNTGVNTHHEIDVKLEEHFVSLKTINAELEAARDEFTSVGARIDATLGKNSFYTIETYNDWNQGSFEGLRLTRDGDVGFEFFPDDLLVDVYFNSINEANKLGNVRLAKEFKIDTGSTGFMNNRTDLILEFKGFLYAPRTGEYKFQFSTLGFGYVQIAGQSIFDANNWYNSTSATAPVYLEGGRLYPVILRSVQQGEVFRGLSFSWQPPDQTSMTLVPTSMMNHVGYAFRKGTYESHIIDLLDNEIAQWSLEPDIDDHITNDDVEAYIATSADGESFSDWVQIDSKGEMKVTPERFLKLKLIPKINHVHVPVMRKIQIRYVSTAANLEYIQEMVEARASYLRLRNRFEAIEQRIQEAVEFYETLDTTMIHPEYFMSIRLATIEINMLEDYVRRALGFGHQLLQDGFVDHFDDLDFIDVTQSEKVDKVGHTINELTNQTILEPKDWQDFTLNKTMIQDSKLQLEPLNISSTSTSGLLLDSTFNNSLGWSTLGEAYSGYYYSYVFAQPFYTASTTYRLKSLRLYRNGSNYIVYEYIKICPTGADGLPDLNNPIYSTTSSNNSGDPNVTINKYVTPNTKYWIVVQTYSWNNANAYSQFWITPDNTNTSDRLRGNNPKNETLKIRYQSYSQYANNSGWSTGSYFLRFSLVEQNGFEPVGEVSHMLDYGRNVNVLNCTLQGQDTSFVTVYAQSSEDNLVWSQETTDFSEVPIGRYLKFRMVFITTGILDTPRITSIIFKHETEDAEIWSHAVELEYVPTHAMFIAKDTSQDNSIRYQISRDDGYTWVDAIPYRYTELRKAGVGKRLRIKAIFRGDRPNDSIDYWGIMGVTHRDISGQNITALYEEYENFSGGEVVLKLKDRYPMGNHALQVYLNGIRQSLWKDYIEEDEYTVRFTEALDAEDRVTFIVQSGAYDQHDITLISRIEALEQQDEMDTVEYEVEYAYDEQGRILKEIYSDRDLKEMEYVYDEHGRKEQTIARFSDKIVVTAYTFDEQNRIVKKQVKHSEVTV